jgi:hypothetical protein
VSLSAIPPNAKEFSLRVYDDRTYTTYDGIIPMPVGFNGFTHLNFTGSTVSLDYRSLKLESNGQVRLSFFSLCCLPFSICLYLFFLLRIRSFLPPILIFWLPKPSKLPTVMLSKLISSW